MKKLLLLISTVVLSQVVSAQYCGNSGPAQCTVSTVIQQPGLTPMWDTLQPFENNVSSTTVIQFQNFDIIYYNGFALTLDSLQIDTIENLPAGLCWASDRASNKYGNSENGCIKVNGVPCDSTGQYKLRIIATVTTAPPNPITLQVDAAAMGNLHYYVRLINVGDTITPVDSAGSPKFIAYGDTCSPPPPPPRVEVGANQAVCIGSTVTINPVITDGQAPFTYLWQSTGDTLSCTTCQSPTALLAQNSTFVLTLTDAYDRVTSDTITYAVTGSGGNFQITAGSATNFCQGSSVTLHAADNPSFSIQWQRNGTDIPNADDTTYVVTDSSGVYSVEFSSGGCTANSNNIIVAVDEIPVVSVTPSGPLGICPGSSVVLQSTTSTAGVSYLWQINGQNLNTATNAAYNASLGGVYRVIVKTPANCADTSNAVTVTVLPLPAVTLASIPDTVCISSGIITLVGSPAGGSYNGNGVSGNSFNPSIAGTGSHTVSYSYTNNDSCSATATRTIVVRLCTGINDLDKEDGIMLFPNPVTNPFARHLQFAE